MMQNTATVIKSAATHKLHILHKQTKLHYSKLMTKHQKRERTDSQLSNTGYGHHSSPSIFNILHHFEESELDVTNHKNCDNVFFTTQTFCNGRSLQNGASQVAFNLGEFTEQDMKEFAKLMELDDDSFFGGASKSSIHGCDVVLDRAQDEVLELLMQDPRFSKTFGGASVKNIQNDVTVVNKVPATTKDAASTVSSISSSSSPSTATTSSSTNTSPSSNAASSPKNVSVSTTQTAEQQKQSDKKNECFLTSLLHREFSFIGNNHKKGKCTFEIQLFENNTNILEAAAQEAAAIDEEEAQQAAAEQQSYRITLVDVEELPNAHHLRNKWSLIGLPAASCLLIEAIPAVEKVSKQQEQEKRFNGSSSSKKKKPSRSYPSSFTTVKDRIKQ